MSVRSILNDFQIHLFHEGSYRKAYETFGAQLQTVDGIQGVQFTVWAPNAKAVSVVGDFNDWSANGDHALVKLNEQGIWTQFIPYVVPGAKYKYKITTPDGQEILKADPFAFASELRPGTASIVTDLSNYKWKDARYRRTVKTRNFDELPINIYEVHLGSWKQHLLTEEEREEDVTDALQFYNYRQLADTLIPYLKEHNFTHVEVMPIYEHPLDASWGYQGVGYYSTTSRFGHPDDFRYFVDKCHQSTIAVIMDWVPGHFCKDAHGLYRFDGAATFEYLHDDVAENVVWGTANFDLGKNEVHSFLISNAYYWLEYFHIDGFRIDAVSNILYWQPNGVHQQNPLGIAFLQKLNAAIKEEYPQAIICAEDSTDYPGVTATVENGGLGFTYKWNMGWMNDVLVYTEAHHDQRNELHHKMTFSMLYNYNEKYILPISHDEVVHGKKSLLNKMPGDYWQKLAGFRVFLTYMYSHPGKKLLFMGTEYGQFDEWKAYQGLDFFLLDYEAHAGLNAFTKDLFFLYKRSKPLWELDYYPEGFQWIEVNNSQQSVFSFYRKDKEDDYLIFVFNFLPHTYENYEIGVPLEGRYREIFNSDKEEYGGSGVHNTGPKKSRKYELLATEKTTHGQPYTLSINVPPLGATVIKPVKAKKK